MKVIPKGIHVGKLQSQVKKGQGGGGGTGGLVQERERGKLYHMLSK